MVVLLSKSETLNLPSKFRPIALLNAEGRLFFTLMKWRLSTYMFSNGYIDTKVQKGFMEEVAGCIEHLRDNVPDTAGCEEGPTGHTRVLD